MKRTEHFVQFYNGSDFPTASVGAFLYEGLTREESCIIAAMPEHLESVREVLSKAGVDLAAAGVEDRFIELNVVETLERIMVEEMPDERAFRNLVRPLMQGTLEKGKVRIFGEIVSVLAKDNNIAASLKLEEYWNALQEEYEFSLFCAYPSEAFADAGGPEALLAMCGEHTHVIPSAAFADAAPDDDRLKNAAFLQKWNEQLYAELAELERNIAEKHQKHE